MRRGEEIEWDKEELHCYHLCENSLLHFSYHYQEHVKNLSLASSLLKLTLDLRCKMVCELRRKNGTAEKPFWNSASQLASCPPFQISLPKHNTSCNLEINSGMVDSVLPLTSH